MRKKLFAVIMSAMMMITFMPAMAFADINVAGQWTNPFASLTVSGVTTWSDTNTFVYDGADHTVTFTKPYMTFQWEDNGKIVYRMIHTKVEWSGDKPVDWDVDRFGFELPNGEWKTYGPEDVAAAKVEYNLGTYNFTTGKYAYAGWTETAPAIKAAGKYEVNVRMTLYNAKTGKSTVIYADEATIKIAQRPVWVIEPAGVILQTKIYDGKGFTLSDKDFTIRGYDATMNDVYPTEDARGAGYSRITTAALKTANSGLVTGDTLYTAANATKADAGVYHVSWNSLTKNANYNVVTNFQKGFDLVIEKADPVVKITSNTMTIKRGKFKAVKFSTSIGTAKLVKTSGNAKITLKNGKLYVKKGLKKGTYKVTVKASVAKDINWNAANRTKTLKIKVK